MDAMDVTWMKYHTALPTTSTTSSRSTDIETPPQRVEYAANVPRTHAPRAAQRAQAAARLSRLSAKFVYPWEKKGCILTHHTPHRAGSPDHDPELEMRGADARGPN